MDTIIVIPALNPEQHLLDLAVQINDLSKDKYPIIVVDDGSDEKRCSLLVTR